MSSPSLTPDRGHSRRLLVTFVIATTAAAVTAGIALNGHHAGEAVVQRTEASHAIFGATPADPSLPAAASALEGAVVPFGEAAPTF